jgi:hypothetical protein
MRTFIRYLRDLLGSAWGVLFVIAGAISTGVTFVVIYRPTFTLPHWLPGAISIVAWLLAPYRLYLKQRAEIVTLAANEQKPRRSKLFVLSEPGSNYIRRGENGREAGMYLELWVSIENKGDRPATVTSYRLRIENVGDFPDVRPEPRTWIWGLRAQHGLAKQGPETVTDYIDVPAERVAARRKLPFMLNSPAPPNVREIRCELTVKDTEGNSASGWITAVEVGSN